MFNHDADFCGMHDCDEIGESAIGDIIITRNKVQCFLAFSTFKLFINSNPHFIGFAHKMQINIFPKLTYLLNKAHKPGARFGYGEKRNRELNSYKKSMASVLANAHINLDLNKTLVSSRYDLVNSILRLHKLLAYYFW